MGANVLKRGAGIKKKRDPGDQVGGIRRIKRDVLINLYDFNIFILHKVALNVQGFIFICQT